MQTRHLLKASALLIAVTISAGSLAAAPSVQKCECAAELGDRNLRAEASELLSEIQSTANKLTRDAATLESFPRMGVSWESHATQLNLAKEHINIIGERLERLQAIRPVAELWQQQAIDSVVPVALNLAERTEAAIQHLNENRRYLWAPVYTDHLTTISDEANRMKESVDLHLEVAGTEDRLEQLRNRLDTASS
jgi:hypothetical protein